MAASQVYVKNPTLNTPTLLPSSNGQTRIEAGQLEYLNPITGTFVRAVRLQDIRQRVLNRSFQRGNGQGYTFAKANGDINDQHPTDRTSFLQQDQPYGEHRDHRHPLLFQVKPTNPSQRPTAYVTNHGRIVLDSFDHGIRDFGNDLPLCISSRIEGWDVETYLRRNHNVTYYDIIARMPDRYLVGIKGEQWHQGPPRIGTISMRATRFRLKAACLAWTQKGDSSAKNEMMLSFMPASCIASNSTATFRDLTQQEQKACETAKGKRGYKGRKAKREAAASQENAINGHVDQHNAEEQSHVVVDDGNESYSEAGQNKELNADITQSSASLPATHEQQSNKRSRGTDPGLDESGEEGHKLPVKRQRIEKVGAIKPAMSRHQHQIQPQMNTSQTDIGSASTIERTIATAMKWPESTLNNEDNDILETLGYTGTNKWSLNLQPNESGDSLPDLFTENGAMLNDFTNVDQYNYTAHGVHGIYSNTNDLPPIPRDSSDEAQGSDPTNATSSAAEDFDPAIPEFAVESFQGMERGDYRYLLPSLSEARQDAPDQVQRALSLTLVDYLVKTGHLPPAKLIEDFQKESYACQWFRLHIAFEECFANQQVPDLFVLPEWRGGWQCWEDVLDEEGTLLWRTSEGEGGVWNPVQLA